MRHHAEVIDAACVAYLCLGLSPQRLCDNLTAKAHDRHRGEPKGRPGLRRTNLYTLLALFPWLPTGGASIG